MDGNRDGKVICEDSKDREYLFWVNDDHDVISGGEEDDDDSSTKDCDDSSISCKRDLEDFTRVALYVPGVCSNIPGLTYYLAFTNILSGTPSANIFEAVDPSMDYLSDDGVADDQIQETKLVTVSSSEVQLGSQYIVPGQTNVFLLEGKSIGRGQLALIVKKDGSPIVSGSTDLEFKSIKNFYEKYIVTTTSGDDVNSSSSQSGTYAYLPGSEDYILFVHGWNMPEWEKERWAETMFKRLWWLGYDGHCGLFSWPTLSGFQWFNPWDSHHYDHSELRSWNSAVALRSRVESLNYGHPGKVRVLAHSMGNVVSSEAIAGSGYQIVHTFLSAQAAIPGHCFDSAVTNYWSGYSTPNVYGHYTSGASPDDPYLASISGGAGAFVRLYNVQDYALDKWRLNNSMKPDLSYWYSGSTTNYNPGAGDRFYYDNVLIPFDDRTLNFPTNRFEIFAFDAESRSQPLGAVGGHVSPFSTEVNLESSPYNFDSAHYSHSREFRSNIVRERPYWETVADQAGFVLLGQ